MPAWSTLSLMWAERAGHRLSGRSLPLTPQCIFKTFNFPFISDYAGLPDSALTAELCVVKQLGWFCRASGPPQLLPRPPANPGCALGLKGTEPRNRLSRPAAAAACLALIPALLLHSPPLPPEAWLGQGTAAPVQAPHPSDGPGVRALRTCPHPPPTAEVPVASPSGLTLR